MAITKRQDRSSVSARAGKALGGVGKADAHGKLGKGAKAKRAARLRDKKRGREQARATWAQRLFVVDVPRRPLMPAQPVRASAPPLPGLRSALMKRIADAIDAVVAHAPQALLERAAAAPTGAAAIAALVSELANAYPAMAAVDPEAPAIARMAQVKADLLAAVPTLSAREVADRLAITPEGVRKARRDGRLLAVEIPAGARYPVFQFHEDAIRPAMKAVLAAFDDVPIGSDWSRLELLTRPDPSDPALGSWADRIVAGHTADVLAAIAAYGETGAA